MNTTPTDTFGPAPKKARLEIIPLIDVIFFLLATFVLFTLSLNKIRSINLDLPVGDPTGQVDDSMLYLQATENHAYLWKIGEQTNPEWLTAAELAPRLADYKRRMAVPKVFIRGDKNSTFGDTIFALDQVRLLEIKQVSVETKVSSTGK